jgi:hypothetical protein
VTLFRSKLAVTIEAMGLLSAGTVLRPSPLEFLGNRA